MPSRCSIAPRARPVKPRPTSARNVRRCIMAASCPGGTSSANRHEIIVIVQHLDQVFAGTLPGFRGGWDHDVRAGWKRLQFAGVLDHLGLVPNEVFAAGLLGCCW